MLGGGMRQVGIIAAAGLFALENHITRLKEDHQRAFDLAQGLSKVKGVSMMNDKPPSNMVYVRFQDDVDISMDEAVAKLRDRNILVGRESENQIRMVLHLWISDDDVRQVITGFKDVLT
jgi:threonine aldolase